MTINKETLIAMATKQVNQCTIFTRDYKKEWEDLKEDEWNWELFQTYFIKKSDEEEQYARENRQRRTPRNQPSE